MIDCGSGFCCTMAARQIPSVKSQIASRSCTRALALALYEWLLIFMLFINAIISYLITKFADYSELQTPCLLCSRLDHVLGSKRRKQYWDLICGKHKLEISSLVYCHAHGKLVDVHGMCETCLFSFATTNKSNTETYRLLVGKLGEDSSFGVGDDPLQEGCSSVASSTRYCTCCNQPWVPRGYTGNAEPDVPLKISSLRSRRIDKQSLSVQDIHKKRAGFHHLPHVGYTELKLHSDSESEVAYSDEDDEATVLIRETDRFKEDHMVQYELKPRIVTLSYDSAMEKLIDPVSGSEPSMMSNVKSDVRGPSTVASVGSGVAAGHGLEELNWAERNLKNEPPAVSESISFDDVPLTSDAQEHPANSVEESDLISTSDAPLTSVARELPANVLKESELFSLDDVLLTSDTPEHTVDLFRETELISLDEAPRSLSVNESPLEVLQEIKIIPHDKIHPVSDSILPSLNFMDDSVESSTESSDTRTVEMEEMTGILNEELHQVRYEQNGMEGASETNFSPSVSTEQLNETATETNASLSKAHVTVTDPDPKPSLSDSTLQVQKTSPQSNSPLSDSTLQVQKTSPQSNSPFSDSTLQVEETSLQTNCSLNESTLQVQETSPRTNSPLSDSILQAADALDLIDAYKIAVANRGKLQQYSEVQVEQWAGKDSSRLSEELRTLLRQISSSARGVELSPKDISPKVSITREDLKTLDGVQLLLQRRFSLERNESNLSLDEVTVGEIEGESEIDRLRRQVEHDRKLLNGLYKELEEERNASAIAANQAMAMITRLQEEKASLQMEALQNLRMMEEQAEYDMEALEKTNDLLAEKEKEIQDLEAELEFYQGKFPNASTIANPGDPTMTHDEKSSHSEEVAEADTTFKDTNTTTMKHTLIGFEDERLYISDCLEKLEKRLYLFSNNGVYSDVADGEEGDEVSDSKDLDFKDGSQVNSETDEESHLTKQENVSVLKKSDLSSLREEVSEVHARLETLKGDLYFLEHIINSLRHGDEGVRFIKEIASHLLALRTIGIRRRRDQAVD